MVQTLERILDSLGRRYVPDSEVMDALLDARLDIVDLDSPDAMNALVALFCGMQQQRYTKPMLIERLRAIELMIDVAKLEMNSSMAPVFSH